MSLFDSDDSLFDTEDVIGKVSIQLREEFKPWHKPRKQFIREKQWLDQLLRMLKEPRYSEIETINYFGLPGGDLLDVNHLSKGMSVSSRAAGKILGIHGFINSSTDYHSALSALTKLLDKKNISPNSKIEEMSFEDLYKNNSEAWNRIKKFGHYHFINLDFCNNVFQKETLVSIFHLLTYQLKSVYEQPWLLCITTRLNRDSASIEVIKLFQSLLDDINTNDVLEANLSACFEVTINELKRVVSLEKVEDKALFNELLQICLILWLVKETTSRNVDAQLKSSFKYSVNLFDRDADMHSLVFYINPNRVVENDLIGLTEHTEPCVDIDYNQSSEKALKKLQETPDLDIILEENPEMLNKYAEEMMAVLSMCGYEISEYKIKMAKDYGYKFSS